MKILITGAKGQLGRELAHVFKREKPLLTDKDDLDITQTTAVVRLIEKLKPDLIIHTAAYTTVDQAESEKNTAMLVNHQGTKNIVEAIIHPNHPNITRISPKLIYISTDYVFDGKKNSPYKETDIPYPLNVYGASKLAGEKEVQRLPKERWLIVRTAWLYGEGKNFVKTILELVKIQKELKVVDDQIGSPTWARDVARAIKFLIAKNAFGLYHVVSKGKVSWYDFAKEILRIQKIKIPIFPIKTKDFPRLTIRPPYSVLSTAKLQKLGFKMPHWKEALKEYLSCL